jgi:cytochrome b
VYPPSVVINYLKSLLTKNPQRYIGHNPVGGWMVIALLVSLTMVTVSGLKLYAIEEGKGPLASAVHVVLIDNAHADDEDEDRNDKEEASEEFWEEIHEVTTNLTLLLILLHIAGVVISSRLHKENLVKSMITGKKEDL